MTAKKFFEDPEIEVVAFNGGDIITSSTDPDDPIDIDPWDDWDD